MMREWLSYSPQDFILFSAETYWRMVASYNLWIWPLQLLTLALCLLSLRFIWTRKYYRWVILIVAIEWGWIGWGYHQQSYSEINWSATYFAWAFYLQALLLALYGMTYKIDSSIDPPHNKKGPTLLLFTVIFSLVFEIFVMGNAFESIEVVGTMPSPTAIFTAGMLLFSFDVGRERPLTRLLLLIPLLWLSIDLMFAWYLDDARSYIMAIAIVLIVSSLCSNKSNRSATAQ